MLGAYSNAHDSVPTICAVLCCAVLWRVVQDASSSIERLRTDLRSWTTRVEAGELQNIGQKDTAAAGGASTTRCSL